MNNKFINEVCCGIKDKNTRAKIQTELESHLGEKIDYYMEIGYSQEEAERKATEDMGDSEDVSVSLNSLHNTKWYKDIKTIIVGIITIIFATISIILTAVNFNGFKYDRESLMLSHNILYDFISMAVLILICVGIHIARKNKNQRIATMIIACIAISFLHTLLLPSLSSIITICTKGFSYYTENIFTSYIIPNNVKGYYTFANVAVAILLYLYTLLVIIGISRHQKMKVTKSFWKPFKIIERVVALFLIINLTIMTGATSLAYSRLDDTIKENERLREDAFYLALNSRGKSGTELIKALENQGYIIEESPNSFPDDRTFVANNQNISFSVSESSSTFAYSVVNAENSLVTKGLGIDEDFIDKYKEGMEQEEYATPYSEIWANYDSTNCTSLKDFLKEDVATKCTGVNKVSATEGEINDTVISFYVNDSHKYYSVSFNFSNNYLNTIMFSLKGENDYESQQGTN